MITANTSTVTKIMSWADKRKIKYCLDILNSQPLYGQYKLVFDKKEDEFLAKMTWGTV